MRKWIHVHGHQTHWLAHADEQTHGFALGTVNVTMALHGGQCQMLLTPRFASKRHDVVNLSGLLATTLCLTVVASNCARTKST